MLCAFMPPSIAQLRAMSAKALRPLTNVLQNSKSPYLLQHKDNPVHVCSHTVSESLPGRLMLTLQWQEWNSDTINLAKELDKPIFLSSGYSACHWCVSPLIYLPLRLAHLISRPSRQVPCARTRVFRRRGDREDHERFVCQCQVGQGGAARH